MRLEDVEEELQKRKSIIEKVFEEDIANDKYGNEYVKYINNENFSNIRAIYSGIPEMINSCYDFANAMLIYRCGEDMHNSVGGTTNEDLKEAIQDFFLELFNKKRAVALINILQVNNNKVYRSEGIQSLQFEKNEILKGFDSKEIEKEGLCELEAKMAFWTNKLTKIMQLMEIDKLKSKPITCNIEENYIFAKKRSEILALFEDLDPKDAKRIQDEIAEGYQRTFGVKIEDDIGTLKELKSLKKALYEVKNTLMADLMIRYFVQTRRGKQLPGIQGMGVKRNEATLTDMVGSYMAVIRLKGYTSNIYLHVPSFCFEEAVETARAYKLPVLVPSTLYSKNNPNKIIPVNVICKVDKNSKRYEQIKKEKEAHPNNEVLKQAYLQAKGSDIPSHSKSNWEHKTIQGMSIED